MTLAQEAANQNTSPNRLRELATLNLELARLVANNSNADSELLRDLISTSDYITGKTLLQIQTRLKRF
ncbi:hypothetical protein NIES2101_10015 [Calothrix sp. HK-06]|nr:hypothetical protein NIES2101_10015 [Calothrix sp. HK-06]